jgi:hypothetical protein
MHKRADSQGNRSARLGSLPKAGTQSPARRADPQIGLRATIGGRRERNVRRVFRCRAAAQLLAEIVRTWDQTFPAADTIGRLDPGIAELLAALNLLVRSARALTD